MTFKVSCDHCGNIVSTDAYHQYTIVDTSPERAAPNNAYTQAVNAQNSMKSLHGDYGVHNHDVHLCPTCFPIWMERVKKLTEHTK